MTGGTIYSRSSALRKLLLWLSLFQPFPFIFWNVLLQHNTLSFPLRKFLLEQIACCFLNFRIIRARHWRKQTLLKKSRSFYKLKTTSQLHSCLQTRLVCPKTTTIIKAIMDLIFLKWSLRRDSDDRLSIKYFSDVHWDLFLSPFYP